MSNREELVDEEFLIDFVNDYVFCPKCMTSNIDFITWDYNDESKKSANLTCLCKECKVYFTPKTNLGKS